MQDNPRGYAYQALTKSYDRIMGWQQYAALDKDGSMPSKYEYVGDGLNLFDRQYPSYDQDITTAKVLIDTIIKEMGRSIVELMKGKMAYPSDSEGTQYIVPKYDTTLDIPISTTAYEEEITLGTTLPSVEEGYAAVDDADEMRYRMRVLADRLRPADMATLMSFVNGDYETLTEACGGSAAYWGFTKRMRTATKGMVMA